MFKIIFLQEIKHSTNIIFLFLVSISRKIVVLICINLLIFYQSFNLLKKKFVKIDQKNLNQ